MQAMEIDVKGLSKEQLIELLEMRRVQEKYNNIIKNAHSKDTIEILSNLKADEERKKNTVDVKLQQASLKVREEMLNDSIFGVKDVKEDLECIQKDIRVILRDLDQIKSELAFIRNK